MSRHGLRLASQGASVPRGGVRSDSDTEPRPAIHAFAAVSVVVWRGGRLVSRYSLVGPESIPEPLPRFLRRALDRPLRRRVG